MLLFGGLVGLHAIDQARARAGQTLASDAQRTAERLNREMANRARDLALFAALDPMRSLKDPAAVQVLLEALRRSEPAYLWLAVTDVSGHVIAATDGGPTGGDVALYDFRDQLRGRPTSVGDPMRFVRPGEPDPGPPQGLQRQFNISRPIRAPDGTAIGVIVAQLSWDDLRHAIDGLLSPGDNGQDRETFVVSSNDVVLLGPPGRVGSRLSIEAVSRARGGLFGWTEERWPDGHMYLTGISFAAGEGDFPGAGSLPMRWAVLVREAASAALAPARELRLEFLTAGLILSALVALLGWVLAGVITGPLRQIARSADMLRKGNAVEMPDIRSSREVEILSSSLRALVATLTAKQDELDVLEEVAQRDLLTGVLNRAGLQTWLSQAVAHVRGRPPGGLLLLLADLDGFKEINDTRGHATGDCLLQTFAQRLIASVRAQDAVARMGGDEFLIVLNAPRGMSDDAALETTRRLWSKVSESYTINGEAIDVGVSIGGAAWPEDEGALDRVLAKADAALYAAKGAGRGQIMFHREPALG
jgi:diguanylate cyclase (GGDEF)-like protein